MKVQIQGLGPIEHAEITLRPLTVFVGPNNSGKTLSAYTLTSILGRIGLDKFVKHINPDSLIISELQKVTQQLLDHGNASLDIVSFAEEYGNRYINEVAIQSKHWLNETLSTDMMSFDGTVININIDDVMVKVIQRVLDTESIRRAVISKSGTILNAVKETGDRSIFFFTSNENEDQQDEEASLVADLPSAIIGELINFAILQILHKSIFRDAIAFPTERTTMISVPLLSTNLSESQIGGSSALMVANSIKSTVKPISPIVGRFMGMAFAARQTSSPSYLT